MGRRTKLSKSSGAADQVLSENLVPKDMMSSVVEGGVLRVKERPKLWMSVEQQFRSKEGNIRVSGGATITLKNGKSSTIKSEFRRLSKLFKEEVSRELLSLLEEE